jgi:hypothetical protein
MSRQLPSPPARIATVSYLCGTSGSRFLISEPNHSVEVGLDILEGIKDSLDVLLGLLAVCLEFESYILGRIGDSEGLNIV